MRTKQRPGQIGDYWLSKRERSDLWYRTWYDPKSRNTRRASLGTADFDEAQLRYYEKHAKHTRSAKISQVGRPPP